MRGVWRRSKVAVAAVVLAVSLTVAGCEGEALQDYEVAQIDTILKTGTTFESDPYVRAETLRVIEVLGEKTLGKYALRATEDSSAMVRVAAVRALLASGVDDAGTTLLTMYGKEKEPVRALLLECALEFADAEVRSQIVERALRSKDPALRKRAFENGPLAELRAAKDAGDTEAIESTLKAKLGTFVTNKDEELAAIALRELVRMGESDRAEPYLKTFSNEGAPTSKRTAAARILWRAKVKAARPMFEAILAPEEDDSEKLGLPIKQVDEQLVRASTLGAVALGNASFVEPAQGYLTDAKPDAFIEVLEALAASGLQDASVSVKIAMRDARPVVRHRAISMYSALGIAEADALMNAMRQDDPRAQKMIAKTLLERFPKEWTQNLTYNLRSEADMDDSLELMRDVIAREDAKTIIAPLEDLLRELSKSDKGSRAASATYLLLLNTSGVGGEQIGQMMARTEDVHTRYVFLEHLLREDAKNSVPIFRNYFYDDLYALRLVSAAGLWKAFRGTKSAEAEQAAPPEE